jgi:sugar phosphate isomerase/epimerase
MQLGFVSAILGDLPTEEVFAFAGDEGFDCVELMCWPTGAADRRYAGVTHVDAASLDEKGAFQLRDLANRHGVGISGLGYYPNLLDSNAEARQLGMNHLQCVISAAARLGVGIVNTFVGRDPMRSIDATWPQVDEIWPSIMAHAAVCGVRIAIENCPMLFSRDEWPGGKNLPTSPALWRQLFERFPDLWLNFDPSHLIWQHIDVVRSIREFGRKIIHVHAKDTRIDPEKLYDRGILGLGWHTAKLPGLGDVDWGAFFAALTDAGYRGAVCIEVEDRAYEGSLSDRKAALRQCRRFLRQFMS